MLVEWIGKLEDRVWSCLWTMYVFCVVKNMETKQCRTQRQSSIRKSKMNTWSHLSRCTRAKIQQVRICATECPQYQIRQKKKASTRDRIGDLLQFRETQSRNHTTRPLRHFRTTLMLNHHMNIYPSLVG
jgi:hypothetical protein